MTSLLPKSFHILPEIARAIQDKRPVLALESAVVTHGLPYPQNKDLALELEEIARSKGVIPATTALVDGCIKIGITRDELQRLSTENNLLKVSNRNVGIGIVQLSSGGTTVAATLMASRIAGIQVFATGGIGGVHRGNPTDVSADLDELARSRVIVVCAGAKSILDIHATLEGLETRGVPTLGFETDEFPAFYSRSSGFKIDVRINSASEAAAIAKAHWQAGNTSAVLVCNPLPEDDALDPNWIDRLTAQAVNEAHIQGIMGAMVSPFLLSRLRDLTEGKSLQANLTLLRNNVRLAAEIATHMVLSKNLVI